MSIAVRARFVAVRARSVAVRLRAVGGNTKSFGWNSAQSDYELMAGIREFWDEIALPGTFWFACVTDLFGDHDLRYGGMGMRSG